MPRAKYVLLDCDNTLCLSEKIAFGQCTLVVNEVLEKFGVTERYTPETLLDTCVGQNFLTMMETMQKRHGFTMSPEEVKAYADKEVEKVTEKLSEECTVIPGVPEQLESLKQQGYPMSVVSTSAKPRVVASLKKCGIYNYFPDEHIYSAATSLPEPKGKPDPAVYNFACQQLGVKNSECVTVEDSGSGATAAMNAGIPCIGFVGVYGIEEGPEKVAEMEKKLREKCNVKVIMYNWSEFPECLKKIEEGL
ncbi:hypothetical protein RRF57_003838 [Xylaria bambusicola]|uniref:Uncharacterized protein n=1 Tax=Xylaria bambusicola TaxID=326684 RepID=A0AAN7UFQ8_9PEZI